MFCETATEFTHILRCIAAYLKSDLTYVKSNDTRVKSEQAFNKLSFPTSVSFRTTKPLSADKFPITELSLADASVAHL